MNKSKKIKLGKNISISVSAKIFDNVVIEDGVSIGDFCLIGFSNKKKNEKLIIKKNTKIGSHTILYGGSSVGENSIIGHNVLIREKSVIDNNVQIGSFCDIEGHCIIESFVKLHSNVHVSQGSKIMRFSWLFPYVILTNDPIPPSHIKSGVIIEPFSVICTRSTILPGIRIGFGSFVGANSLVNINLDSETIGTGNPFRTRGKTDLLKLPNTNKNAYPWIDRFKKDYPKNIKKIYNTLKKKF